MKAEIINIGDELLIGQVINTNASWMAEQLTLAGIEISRITTISDDKEEIINAIDSALKTSSIILMTGGLGPTKDDITKEVLCEYFNTSLVFNNEVYDHVKELFKMYGYKVSSINRKQAEIPENCIPLQNKNGTAPGMWFDINNKIIVSMPGVPFEMKDLITNQVIPKLHETFQFNSRLKKTILTQGVGESHLAEIIADWENELPPNFKIAYLPQPGIVRLRLSAKAKEKNTLEDTFNKQLEKLVSLIPDLIFGYDEDRLEAIIGNLLIRNEKTLSTAESCSGGYIAHLITDITGSSNYFKGSVVAYSNDIKEKILTVKKTTLVQHGAVSEEVVKEMALGIQSLYKTDYAIATSGIAGPSGGSKEKPVGTIWIAIALPNNTVIAKKYLLGKHRGRNVRKTALTALNLLRKALLNT